jgi:DNA-binding CsgD family transcriptional regulator
LTSPFARLCPSAAAAPFLGVALLARAYNVALAYPRARPLSDAMSRSAISHSAVLRLVEHIYQTVNDPASWPAVLAEISDALNGGVAALLYHDVRAHHGGLNQTVRLAPEAIDVYQQHFHSLDPWGKGTASLGLGKTGAVLNGDQLIALPELRRTEYYADYATRYDLVRILAGVVIADGPVLSVISILRPENAQPFGAEEQRTLAALMGHLKCVLEIRRKVEGLQLIQAASNHALNQLPTGVVLVDASARIVFANVAAEHALRSADGLTVERGRLAATLGSETTSLRSLINAAVLTTKGDALHAGKVMTISRPQSLRPLSVLVTAVPRDAGSGTPDRAAAAVFISNPDRPQSPDPAVLRTVFHLTGAECRLAIAICSGSSLAQAAASLEITKETAKSCLKSVFAKTGTSRQSELVTIVSRLAGSR